MQGFISSAQKSSSSSIEMEECLLTSETELQSLPPPSSSPSSETEKLMKLLRGKTDSQRLAGLLLVTKLFDKDDQRTILDVYHALGSAFLHRLLLTGMGKGGGGGDDANREAYLRLSVTVLAAFARIPQIAATDEMLSEVPLILEVLSGESVASISEECYEFLFLVTSAHNDGVITLYKSGGMNVLASQMPTLSHGSHAMELATKLAHLIISKLPAEKVYADHPSELSKMVAAIAKQFALVHNSVKFEALHLLSTILSSKYSEALNAMLQSMKCKDWSTYIRVGIMDVLQNRVAPADKLHALVLVEHVISIIGEEWLVGPTTLPDARNSFPADRCILLVLETSRVEIAVALNELAYLKYEAPKDSPQSAEKFPVTIRNLGIAFSLVERIIKFIAKFAENEESNSAPAISESTSSKIIGGLNETIDVVLDYMQDAKDHGERKGDDVLSSVRIVGSYLAEVPCACREKVEKLLGYMLTVEGEDEISPFYSITFLLPMLCQITMETDGCKLFASAGGFEAVISCLVSLIQTSSSSSTEDGSTIFLACDTILNFLLKREQVDYNVDNPITIKLMKALLSWAENGVSVIMMASSICSLILDSTCEEALLRNHPNDFNVENLYSLSQLMKRSLVDSGGQEMMCDDANSEGDLREIVRSGYSSWGDRFPLVKQVVETK